MNAVHTQYSITKINWSTLFKEKIPVYTENIWKPQKKNSVTAEKTRWFLWNVHNHLCVYIAPQSKFSLPWKPQTSYSLLYCKKSTLSQTPCPHTWMHSDVRESHLSCGYELQTRITSHFAALQWSDGRFFFLNKKYINICLMMWVSVMKYDCDSLHNPHNV
jgi:hypothetical protein